MIARVSAAFEPFVVDTLTRAVTARKPRRVLDIGCGAGLQLVAMLRAAPEAEGVGVEADPDAAALAGTTVRAARLTDRCVLAAGDLRDHLAERPSGPLAEPFDLILMANVVY